MWYNILQFTHRHFVNFCISFSLFFYCPFALPFTLSFFVLFWEGGTVGAGVCFILILIPLLPTFILISDVVAAKNFNIVQKQVAEMINGRTLVGHALHNDLKVSICSCAVCTFYLYHLTDPDTI